MASADRRGEADQRRGAPPAAAARARALRRSAPSPERSFELDGRGQQAPADREPDRDRDQERRRRQQRPRRATKSPIAPSSGRIDRKRRPVARTGADAPPGVDPDQCAGRRGLDEAEPEQRERRADDHRERAPSAPAASPVVVDPRPGRALRGRAHCRSVMTNAIGIRSRPMPEEEPARARRTSGPTRPRIWPQLRRRASRSGAAGVHVARTATNRRSAPSTRRPTSAIRPGLRRSS